MRNIGESLKKKIGPLPAWAWILGFGVLVWYYRNKLSGGSVSGTGTGSVAPTTPTPQPITTLAPGEAAYDPNTGTLSTNPAGGGGGSPIDGSTGGGGGGGGGPDPTATDTPLQPIDSGVGPLPPGYGAPVAPTPLPNLSPLAKPALIGKGAIWAPFGPRKPKAPKGYTAVGRGRGFWEFKPVRHPTHKAQHGPPKGTTKHTRPGTHSKPRSGATVRHDTGGRTSPQSKAPTSRGKTRGGVKPALASAPRQQSTKRTNPMVTKPVVRQRPVASNTPNRPAAAPSVHRTASTPARSTSRSRVAARPAPVVSHPAPPPPPPPRAAPKPPPKPAPKRKR